MKKRKIFVIAACVLCTCAVLVTGYARYVSKPKGEDSARVAAFAISATVKPETDVTAITGAGPGKVKIGTLTVTNQENKVVSEVTTKYHVELIPDHALPVGVSLELHNGDAVFETSLTDGYVFEDDSFVFSPKNAQSDTYDVYLCWTRLLPSTKGVSVTASVVSEQVD